MTKRPPVHSAIKVSMKSVYDQGLAAFLDNTLGFLLLTRINFGWISNHIPSKVWVKLLIHSQTVEVCEWISDFISHFIIDVIADPYRDLS